MSLFKPDAYTTVSPYLIVNDAGATIKFLKQVFGAIELRRFPDDAGRLMHAEIRIDDTVLMVADSAPPEWPPIDSYAHICVKDVDETYRKALAAGAVSVQVPVKKQDDDKRGGVMDAGGAARSAGVLRVAVLRVVPPTLTGDVGGGYCLCDELSTIF